MKGVASFAAVLLLGLLLWPAVSGGFTSAFQGMANATLGAMRFGKGGHAQFLADPSRASVNATRDASWEAPVELRVEGVEKRHVVSVNPRRLAYLPLLTFAALVAAAPLRPRAKALCLLIGSSALAGVALASVWIVVAWIFARVPGLVYDLDAWHRTLLDFSYEAFVTPMGNKFVLPVLLAAGLVAWQRARETRTLAQSVVQEAIPLPAHAAVSLAPHPRVRVRRKRRRRKR